jgi:Cu+-exporting ATPase
MPSIVPEETDRKEMARNTRAIPITPSHRLPANLSIGDGREGFQLMSKNSMRVRDPVCGRSIDVAEAVAAEDDGGWIYFFCSTTCHGRFKSAPGRYTGERPLHREDVKTNTGATTGMPR